MCLCITKQGSCVTPSPCCAAAPQQRSETYEYYKLPYCKPKAGVRYKTLGMGEVVDANRMATTPYQLAFRTDRKDEVICEKTLSDDDMVKFRKVGFSRIFEVFLCAGARRGQGGHRGSPASGWLCWHSSGGGEGCLVHQGLLPPGCTSVGSAGWSMHGLLAAVPSAATAAAAVAGRLSELVGHSSLQGGRESLCLPA